MFDGCSVNAYDAVWEKVATTYFAVAVNTLVLARTMNSI